MFVFCPIKCAPNYHSRDTIKISHIARGRGRDGLDAFKWTGLSSAKLTRTARGRRNWSNLSTYQSVSDRTNNKFKQHMSVFCVGLSSIRKEHMSIFDRQMMIHLNDLLLLQTKEENKSEREKSFINIIPIIWIWTMKNDALKFIHQRQMITDLLKYYEKWWWFTNLQNIYWLEDWVMKPKLLLTARTEAGGRVRQVDQVEIMLWSQLWNHLTLISWHG